MQSIIRLPLNFQRIRPKLQRILMFSSMLFLCFCVFLYTLSVDQCIQSKHNECIERLKNVLNSNNNGNNIKTNNDNVIKSDSKNVIPQIPNLSFSAVPMAPIPPIPIPALSEAASLGSNENCENMQLPQAKNNGKFQFNMFDQKLASPQSSNSTFSPSTSTFSNTQSTATPTLNQTSSANANANANNGNVILARDQYNFLLQSLHRLTNSQQSQKETIAQLLRRINTLESRMNDQSIQTEQFWSFSNQNSLSTPSQFGYSLANDFNAMTQQSANCATLSSNSSQTPPVSTHMTGNFDIFHHGEDEDIGSNDEDIDEEEDEDDDDKMNGNNDEHRFMFNDISMTQFDANSNEYPPYI